MTAPRPVISLLTDFGLADHYAGVMKGVMLGICPDAQLVDISHQVAPYAIGSAAWILAQSWTHFPIRTVHLVVVDPGVGSSRNPILVEAGGHLFVAPDNGVLTMIVEAESSWRAWRLTQTEYFSEIPSQTFHGRDLFAPVAAHLAAGANPETFGERLASLILLPSVHPVQIAPREWRGTVVHIDRFGNIITNFRPEDAAGFPPGFELRAGAETLSGFARSYAERDDPRPFLIWGSSGYLEISLNQENASERLNIGVGSPIFVTTLV